MKYDRQFFADLRAAAGTVSRNPHGLSYETIYNRIARLKWSLDDALNTPRMTKSQAGQRAAKNPNWRNFTITEPKHER